MQSNSTKIFEYLCLAASLITWIAIFIKFLNNFPHDLDFIHKGSSSEKIFIEIIFVVLQLAIATLIASPILGLPYWLALLVSRRQSKAAKILLYFYTGFMAFAFLGHAMHSSILTSACAYYLTEVIFVSLSLLFLSLDSENVRRYKY